MSQFAVVSLLYSEVEEVHRNIAGITLFIVKYQQLVRSYINYIVNECKGIGKVKVKFTL